MPTNLYGPEQNYRPTNSRIQPALIHRFHEAVEANAPIVSCWVTGSPLPKFLGLDDLCEACVFALEHWSQATRELTYLNVGTGVDLSIRALAEAVATATDYQGAIHLGSSKPDGTPKKHLDMSHLATLCWRDQIPLAEGLGSTVTLLCEELAQQLVRL